MSDLLKKVLLFVLLAFIIGVFLIAFVPTMESNLDTANITNPVTSTLLDMLPWLIPVLAFAGLVVAGASYMISHRKH